MIDPTTCGKAATLVRHALTRTPLDGGPSSDAYSALLRQAATDHALLQAVSATAEGLGLAIVGMSMTSGLVLANHGDAPFAVRLADLADKRQGQEGVARPQELQVMAGLALCAIVAAAFPGRGELTTRSDMAVFTVGDVLRGLREAESLADRPSDGVSDVETCASVLRRFIDIRPDAKRTSPNTREGAVRKVLAHLRANRMVHAMPKGSGEEGFRATDAFRKLAHHAVRHPLLEAVLDVARTATPAGEA